MEHDVTSCDLPDQSHPVAYIVDGMAYGQRESGSLVLNVDDARR